MGKKTFLAKAAIAANLLLAGAGALCIFVLVYFAYYYSWTGQRQFTSSAGVWFYYVLPAVSAMLLFISIRLRPSYKINIILSLISVAAAVFFLEIAVTIWFGLPSVIEAQNRRIRAEAAKKAGIDYDARSKLQVFLDLVSQGVDAIPSFDRPLLKEQSGGVMESEITINSTELLPLALLSNKLVVFCNESGRFLTYKSDNHGFHNPAHLWDITAVDIVAVGDSYVQGYCVEENFVDLIRKRYPATLNLGMEGNGPLAMLATLKEYANVVKPKVVLWFYYEGNDLADLSREQKSHLLRLYLTKGFSQGLFNRQAEIDRALTSYLETVKARSSLSTKLQELSTRLGAIGKWQTEISSILRLCQLRQRLGLVYGKAGNSMVGSSLDPASSETVKSVSSRAGPIYEILLEAKRSVNSWGGKLYFVYLPSYNRYVPGEELGGHRDEILSLVGEAGIPIIDIHQRFEKHADPPSLFPFRLSGHFDQEGHRLVAEEVLESISVGK
jgi:hypothetical protein